MSDNGFEITPEREHRIRERAYYLWEADGGPPGRDLEYWQRARELIGMEEGAGSGLLPNPQTHDSVNEIAPGVVEAAIQERLGEFPSDVLTGRVLVADDGRAKTRGNNGRDKVAAAATLAVSPADTQSKPPDAKVKDVWDKAQIISGFVASVVIATVGLLINSSIQNAQIVSAEKNTQAQIAVADRNAKAQIELAERNAEIQEHLQEGTLTSQLVENLVSDNSLKKRIAIAALQRSVPSELYQNIISILVTSDTDPEVRKTAYMLAGTIRTPNENITTAVAQAAVDPNRSDVERQTAQRTYSQIELNLSVPRGVHFLSSAGPSEAAAAASPFTQLLIEGLSGKADLLGKGRITFIDLVHFVQHGMEAARSSQHPLWVVDTEGKTDDPALFGSGTTYSKIISVVICNSNSQSEVAPRLPQSEQDAHRFAVFLAKKGSEIVSLFNLKAADVASAIVSLRDRVDTRTLLIVFYTGASLFSSSQGKGVLLFNDGSTLSSQEFLESIESTPAATRVLLVDSSFAVGAPAFRL